jgi:dihydrofolate reductase
MRELTVDLFCTVDGLARGTDSPAFFGYDGPGLQAWITAEMARPQVLLMGRHTYELLRDISRQTGDHGMDPMPKAVATRSLTGELDWNATAVADVRAFKDSDGDPLRTIGSVSLVTSLLADGLVDRLRLVVFPLILGATGVEPIFAGLPDLTLELLHSEVLDGRLLAVTYRVVR